MPSSSPLAALQALAARLAAEGHVAQAIKCLEACLTLAPMPADEACVRLRAARLLLEHTSNVSVAKQHLQKAQLLAQRLPSHHVLKCEVAAQLGRAHKYANEAAFELSAYAKGLEACKHGACGPGGGAADGATRAQLQRWACYFELRSAAALAAGGDAAGAAVALERAVGAATAARLSVEAVVARLFQLQLCMQSWDRPGAEAAIRAISDALQRPAGGGEGGAGEDDDGGLDGGSAGAGGSGGEDGPAVQQLKLHFNILQIIYTIRLGSYEQLVQPAADAGDAAAPPLAVATMEELLAAIAESGGAGAYDWLPLAAQEGLVHLLAATVLRAPGKVKQAHAHVAKGLAAVCGALGAIGRRLVAAAGAAPASQTAAAAAAADDSDAWGERDLDHVSAEPARALVTLRALLLESRAQLHLLGSDFAAARADAAAAAALHARFPRMLAGLRPALHMLAALYAHSVGQWQAARAQYEAAAAATRDPLAASHARSLSAMAALAAGGDGAVGDGIAALGGAFERGGAPAGYGAAERALAQAAGALLRLATPGGGPAQDAAAAAAKVALGKALKAAHHRLYSHQLVTQLLNAMAPLRVEACDAAGAAQMLTSSFTLAKGVGDLNAQVAALAALQRLYAATGQGPQAAQNGNYLNRKRGELSARLAAADADAKEHAAVLGWGL